MSANDKQVGGNHYKNPKLPDHWDVAYELKWCYLVAAATKYLWRLGRKGDEQKKLEDVEKAIHYLQKKAEQLRAELAEDCEPQAQGYVNQDGALKPEKVFTDSIRSLKETMERVATETITGPTSPLK